MKAQKFFRYLWRVDAVLILVAAGLIAFGAIAFILEEVGGLSTRGHKTDAGVVVVPDSRSDLKLGRAEVVPGSMVMRADLYAGGEGKGFSSGGYSETRNILFIDPNQGAARWLLPDNNHVIAENSDIKDDRGPKAEQVVATVVLVKPRGDESVNGRLLLFNSSGTNIVEVANDATELSVAHLTNGELAILYERNRHFILASFDASSLAKKKEQEIEVPQLK